LTEKPSSTNSFSLDFTLPEFKDYLLKAIDVVISHYDKGIEGKVSSVNRSDLMQLMFDEELPEEGMSVDSLLQEVRNNVVATSLRNIDPKVFAYVMSGGNQISVGADLIASALNQNVAKWHLAPSITEIEQTVIRWASTFIGYGTGVGGTIVGGGSAANLTALTVARNVFFEAEDIRRKGLANAAPLTVYASEETHNCIVKSVELLGIGSDYLRKIPTDNNLCIDVDALAKHISEDENLGFRPFCVVGNAGTVNTGAIDPLDEIATITESFGIWFHVDGCYGGLAAGLREKAHLYEGLSKANSIALDFHKWLYQPFEIGCTLVKSFSALKRSYQSSAVYLDADNNDSARFDAADHHFDLSRSAKALKVWMSFKAYGAKRFRSMIRKDIDMAGYLQNLLENNDNFEVIATGPLAIICFRFVGCRREPEQVIDQLNRNLIRALETDGRIFITGSQLWKRPVLRACIINHRMQKNDIEYFVKVVEEVGSQM
jgi:aromatic-L-amino-acid decarboxylase